MDEPLLRHLSGSAWELEEDYPYTDPVGVARVIPAGFIFDLASIPRALWALAAPFDLGCGAALVHDDGYGYAGHGVARRSQVDLLFLRNMKESGVPAWRRYPAYLAVRLAGGRAWGSRLPLL